MLFFYPKNLPTLNSLQSIQILTALKDFNILFKKTIKHKPQKINVFFFGCLIALIKYFALKSDEVCRIFF